jgi:hypothetical protein
MNFVCFATAAEKDYEILRTGGYAFARDRGPG